MLAIAGASEIIAAATVRAAMATAETDSPLTAVSATIRALSWSLHVRRRSRTGEHLKPMNQLSDSIIHRVHSKPNGYQSARLAGQDIFGNVTAGNRLQMPRQKCKAKC
jgi:hypothetical protein